MTVPSTDPTITYSYTGPGRYDFGFLTYKEEDIHVYHTDVDGITSELLQGTDYTVFISDTLDGGYVTVLNEVIENGTLNIRRYLLVVQETDWVNNDPMDAATLETSFDRIVMMIQQLDIDVSDGSATSTWRGDWLVLTDYAVKDVIVAPDNSIYVCIVAHTSSTDFTVDLATGVWQLSIDIQSIEELTAAAEEAALRAQESATTAANAAEAAEGYAQEAALSRDAAAISEANSATAAQNASNCSAAANTSSDTSQLAAWDAEADRMTADSYATEAEDVPVNIWTSNDDGTFTSTPTDPAEFSALHWAAKASAIVGSPVTSVSVAAPITNTGTAADPIIGLDAAKIAEWDGKGQVDSIVAGDNITVDATDPANPIVASTGGGSGGGGLAWSVVAVNTNAVSGEGYMVDHSAGAYTITLPLAPSEGDQVGVKDYANNFDVENLTVDGNGEKFSGFDGPMIIDTRGFAGTLTYADAARGWLLTSATPMAVTQGVLDPEAVGVFLTGGMHGLNYYKTGFSTIQVDAGTCLDKHNMTALSYVGGPVTIPTTPAASMMHLFLCDDGVVRTDTSLSGATLELTYKIRWIGYVYLLPTTGEVASCKLVGGRYLMFTALSSLNYASIAVASTVYDWSAFMPVSRVGIFGLSTYNAKTLNAFEATGVNIVRKWQAASGVYRPNYQEGGWLWMAIGDYLGADGTGTPVYIKQVELIR